VSVAGGFSEAIRRGTALSCEAIQIFTKSNRQWAAPPITDEEADAFIQAWQASTIRSVFVHSAYLINLASSRDSVREKSRAALADEVRRADKLGIPFVVFHPGSHGGDGNKRGLERLIDGLRAVLDDTSECNTALAVESMAGQGTCIGASFDHLATIMEKVPSQRLGVCLDSCHLHASGYALDDPVAVTAVLDEFAGTVGFDNLLGTHLNDSRHPAGSRRDRHEHIGDGHIGEEAFQAFVRDPRFSGIPMVLETPKNGDDLPPEDIRNLATLRRLIANSPAPA
jgi:deoxyribonuclease-4